MQRRRFILGLMFLEAGCMEQQSLEWRSVRSEDTEGKGWATTAAPFDRLPTHAQASVPPSVWNLAHHSAGMCFRFVTASAQVGVRWSVGGELAMPHMPASGVSGVDLYGRDAKSRWRFMGVGQPRQQVGNQVIFPGASGGPREFLLYFPLYNSTARIEIGTVLGMPLLPPPPRTQKPIVFYGTSITQGGCASRPGMAFTAITARTLERAHINLGFSGNGKMELALAELLGELDASVFVLDCLRNMSEDLVRERMEPFLRRLREKRPTTPILCAGDAFLDNPAEPTRSKLTREAVEKLTRSGIPNLHYLPMRGAWGDDGEGTVDGVHPTDLGMSRQASVFVKALRKLV
ncbi:SGNH/GDSL hydrolase family protein [Armatimonas sp.]|uniref:SGNH/GDSL hydrolase family protein n=1 Tax=Armatimonas sp. TaxID=1872638 RepID=UPI0037501B19